MTLMYNFNAPRGLFPTAWDVATGKPFNGDVARSNISYYLTLQQRSAIYCRRICG
jgi:hypothetical protein